MAEDIQQRLRKLTAKRNSGVLSEAEYQIARTRLLAAAEARPSDDEDDESSILRSYWPALVGFGILLLMILGVVVWGRMQAEQDMVDLNVTMSNELAANLPEAAGGGEAQCSADAAYVRIKDMIFDRAQQQYGGDPGPLDSLRKVVGVRMLYPMLRSVHQDLGRTDCGGHFVLDLPPSVHAAFDGLSALEADIQYSVQPAADDKGNVVELAGVDAMVEQLAVAASVAGGRGKEPAGVAQQPKVSPSFDCRGTLTNVERMICQDSQLSLLDLTLAERYQALRRELPRTEWQVVSDSQREFLRRRARCTVVACLHDAYSAQTRFLSRFETDDRAVGRENE